MIPLTCPYPANINPLQVNGFMFNITKLPELSFFCQEVSIPQIFLGDADMSTPFTNIPMPGDKLVFGDLEVTFVMDSEMKNYRAINAWMNALGFPENREQFSGFVDQNADQMGISSGSTNMATMSDATLMILGNTNNAVATMRFIDLFPTTLSGINMQSTVDGTVYLSGQATFKYSHYVFVD